ncbi:MAG TPA: GNAT family N-acetyltransferase [Nocardioidaceae bacterium]|nr:GNAT family N-acetyltransferase [Nocardioidaceae bacterium]
MEIEIGEASADDVERILRALPDWFGIESALVSYVEDARSHPVIGARVDERVVGILVQHQTSDVASEVHLLAVEPGLHRRGVGRALMAAAEDRLAGSAVRLFHVKTLGPSDPDEHYARTRAFYEGLGFLPLEELPDLWPGNPCLILVKPLG